MHDRLETVRQLAGQVHRTEISIDDAITETAKLLAALPDARRRARISPSVGVDAVALVGEASQALIVAHRCMAEAHAALAQIKDDLQISNEVMPDGGDLWKIPRIAENGRRRLTVVASAKPAS